MEVNLSTPLIELIRYNNWANQQVLQACQQLSAEQLATPIPGGYGTIYETLEHILRAEAGYVRLLTGRKVPHNFNWEDRPDLLQMGEYAELVGEQLLEAVRHISQDQILEQDWDGKLIHYQALALYIQIINHGIEHRTNITTNLNQGLLTPPEVDGWTYLLAFPDHFDLKWSD